MLNALTRLITVLLIAGGVRHICNKLIYTGVMGITAPLVIRIIWISSPTRASSFGSQRALHITTHTVIIQPHVARFECGRNTHPPPLAACCLIPVYPHLIGCNLHACTTCKKKKTAGGREPTPLVHLEEPAHRDRPITHVQECCVPDGGR